MFRPCLSQAPRSVASTSLNPASSYFHTAAVLHAVRRQGQSAKKKNIQRTRVRQKNQAENQPSVVLGTRPLEEVRLWPNCDLAKCLVNPHNLNGPPATTSSPSSSPASVETRYVPELGEVKIPKALNYGVGEVEKKMLFEELPRLTSQAPFIAAASNFTSAFQSSAATSPSPEIFGQRQEEATRKEVGKANAFAAILDLRNANARGIAYENRRRIILKFSDSENPFDPGRAEVQAALLTYQIRNLWSHLTQYKRDVGNRLGLRKLVHQRAKILRYLKSKDQDRYEALLPRLALDPKSVEGELVI